jgi:hypothetical protein
MGNCQLVYDLTLWVANFMLHDVHLVYNDSFESWRENAKQIHCMFLDFYHHYFHYIYFLFQPKK